MPKAPKASRTTTYDRVYLEGLRRAQIQALAKAENIKANGKTAVIIAQLLTKTEAIEVGLQQETAVASGSRSQQQMSGNQPVIDLREWSSPPEQDQEPELIAIKSEPDLAPRTPPSRFRSPRALRTPSTGAVRTPSPRTPPRPAEPQTPLPRTPSPRAERISTRSTQYRVPTPYPKRLSSSVSSESEASGSPSARTAIPALVDNQPTDKEVRKMRRDLAEWVSEQAVERSDLTELQDLLQYTERKCAEGLSGVADLAWRREAIETMILPKLKQDRFLWDGTATMKEGEAKATWTKFVEESWIPLVDGMEKRRMKMERRARRERQIERHQRRADGEDLDSDSDESSSDYSLDSTAESLEEEAGVAKPLLVVEEEDGPDDIYM